MIIGIDIGGANTKAASSDGKFTYTKYLPLWRGSDIEGTLRSIKEAAGNIEAAGITITGELADCYKTKKEGLEHISGIVKKVFVDAVFFGIDGKFYRDVYNTELFSASNWAASAKYVGEKYKDILFIDIGSTTTDIIPVINGEPEAGHTDLERLGNGELVYAGALRTNVATITDKINVRGKNTRTSSELFTITADTNLFLGLINEADYTCDAPDGGERDINGCAVRIAKLVVVTSMN